MRSSSPLVEIKQGGCHSALTGAVSVLLWLKLRLDYFTTAFEGQEAFQLLVDIVIFCFKKEPNITLPVNFR